MRFLDVYKRLVLEANANKRIEFLKNKYQQKLINFLLKIKKDEYAHLDEKSKEVHLSNDINTLINAIVSRLDPTNGVYSEWILKNIFPLSKDEYERLFGEDFYKVFDDLTDYHRYKHLFKNLAQKENDPNILKLADINQIKGFVELYNAIRLIDSDIDGVEAAAEEKRLEKEVEKIYVSENYIILIPKTQEASCVYGKGTRWCTAADKYNAFNRYNRQGPLYIIIDRQENEKFQFHFQSEQYRDSTDTRINLKNFFLEHKELNKPLLLEALKQNSDSFIQYFSVSELMEISNDNVEYVPNFIRHDMLFAIEYSNKDEKLVNETLSIYQFDGENVKIDLSKDIGEFSDLVEYVIEDDSQKFCQEILEMGASRYYDYSASEYTKLSEIVDILNEKNKHKLESYLKKHNFELSDLWESDEPEEVSDFLKRCYDIADGDATDDAYYKIVVDSIADAIGKYGWVGEKLFLDWSKKQLLSIVNTALDANEAEEILQEFGTSFIKAYHLLLKENDELEEPDFRHVYAHFDDIKQHFNDRFSEDFDLDLEKPTTESIKKLNILELCLESLKNVCSMKTIY